MKLETKLKHTPAPWQLTTIDGVPRRKHLMVGAGYDGGLAVALMRTDHAGATSETLEANARLIAAAPELLAALRYIVIGDEDHEDLDVCLDVSARRKADAALAKAIGETQE